MTDAPFPILSIILILPLVGAFVVCFCRSELLAKRLAMLFAGVELLLSLGLLVSFNSQQGNQFQYLEHYEWIPGMHIEFLIGVDGLSIVFLPLSSLLTLLSIGAAWNSIGFLPRFHFALLLALESVTLGIFCALDMVLFFLFWELTLPPLFFLISLWGIGAQRRNAAMKYTLFMLFGGVPLLFAILILAMNHPSSLDGHLAQNMVFSLPTLLKNPLPVSLQNGVFLLLVLGFAVKVPLFPFHTWLPTAAMEGPTHITALLTGLKLGVFGMLRFALPLAPAAAVNYSWVLSILGAFTLIYGALIALNQTNLRRLLAFASISHVGLVVMGLASLTIQGVQGALLQLFNFTVIASSLILMAGFIQQRLGSTEAIHLGGLAQVMPRLTCVYFVFTLASINMPGSSGFPAELLLILSVLQINPALGFVALLGEIISAAYMFSFTRRVFFGPIVHSSIIQTQDIRPRELALMVVPALFVLCVGLFPTTILNITQVAAETWLRQFQITNNQ